MIHSHSETISICIVSYQACDYLKNCLSSVEKHSTHYQLEIIIVDNGSTDDTQYMVQREFPNAIFHKNSTNLGYTVTMNHALRQARGNYLVMLNPDTLIYEKTLDTLADYLKNNPGVGICGPKVLNPDGTLQKSCRRGESTPSAVIAHMTGFDRLFPNNPIFSQYWMSYKNENDTHEVAGISGSCMMLRRELLNHIGYLDERFFAYQEDADYCFRARNAGWRVVYTPTARVLHYGGVGGSHVHPYRSIFEWHRSYWNYYRKNLAHNYPVIFNWFYYLAMVLKLGLSLFLHFIRIGRFAKNWNNS